MNLIYKTLFEIKLEHEYFLSLEDGKSLFEEAEPVARMTRLNQAYDDERESFSRDISYDFPEKLKPLYEQHGLKLLPNYSGFRVLARVNPLRLADNSTVFEPFFPFSDDLEIFILLIKKNSLPDAYTNGRLNRSIPSQFIFSNENINGARTFPFIVSPVSPFDPGISYEQGELALDAGNNLIEIFYDNTGSLQQGAVNTAVTSFAGENDRMLVPGKFYYNIPRNHAVTELEISLTDNSANVIKQFSFSQAEPLSRILLDFTDKADILQLSERSTLQDKIFTINATGNNGWNDTKNIVFGDHLSPVSVFGAVHIRSRVTNSSFNILTDEGRIIQNRDPSGVLSAAPVFEIPIKSRYGHFRYTNSNGKELLLDASLNNFLFKENQALITQMPVSLSRYYLMIHDNTMTATKYLPNPRSYDIKKDAFNRIYFDIPVPESDNFPIH
jgi:hypothetical protein